MPAMFDLITLYREAIHKPDTSIVKPADPPELAMDYFDTLIARHFSNMKKDSVKEFLGLNIDEEFDQNRVAMQSIPLYCPGYIYDVHHEKNPDIYRDPFLVKKSAEEGSVEDLCAQMPYLSVIEVFITPEVIARLDMDAVCNARGGDCFDDEERRSLRIYNAFYRDLHLLMEGFLYEQKKTADEKFIYCIYESVSIGDFAVVIRSSRPETAFKVTTLLRERSCRLDYLQPEKKRKDDPESLVLYKTFTIFSLNEKVSDKDSLSGQILTGEKGCGQEEPGGATKSDIISADDEETDQATKNKEDSCRYVLRGVLSNHYWNTYGNSRNPDELRGGKACSTPELRDVLNDEELRPFLRRLHGRYDFTVTISERAFRAIHPILIRYKLDRNIKIPVEGDKPDIAEILREHILTDEEIMVCETLIGYICNGYVSYINERYLFSLDTSGIRVTKYNENICLLPVNGSLEFTIDYIEEEIQKLKKRIRKSCGDLLFLSTSRRSLLYSMKLLEKLCNMCSAVNGISDARIYSLVICRQIEAVLNGADEYITYLNSSGNLAVVEHLDQDMKAAVESINSFAQFILESTVQSFQTPIYNLESHVSVEKMLTGYSWMLQSVFRWFEDSDFFKEIAGGTQKYLTVMVPDGFDGSLSTKSILFKLNDRNNGAKEKLLTVYCPSFTDLTDFTGSFGAFFHEMAHYMRYESRNDRNRMILKYSSMLLFDQTANVIVLDFQHHEAGIVDSDTIWTILIQCFSEAYQEAVYPMYSDLKKSAGMNLMLLIQEIQNAYRRFIQRIRFLSSFEIALDAFLDNSSNMADPSAREAMTCFKTIREKLFYESDALRDPEAFAEQITKGYDLLSKYLSERTEKEEETSDSNWQFLETTYLAMQLQNVIDEIGGDKNTARKFVNDSAAIQLFYKILSKKLQNNEGVEWDSDKRFRFLQFLFGDLNRKNEKERVQVLRRYVSIYIESSESKNLRLFEMSMAVYREVSSDLYMAKSLKLTPFGYLNFLVRNTPMEIEMGETYMERFCKVLYAMEGKGKDQSEPDWKKLFLNMFKGLRDFMLQEAETKRSALRDLAEYSDCSAAVKAGLARVSGYFEELGECIEADSVPSDEGTEELVKGSLTDACSFYLENSLTPMWEKTGKEIYTLGEKYKVHSTAAGMRELDEAFRDIKHLRYLCQAFIRVVEEFDEQRARVERFPFLAEDLFTGNRKLEAMSGKLENSSLMRYYCSKVSLEYNEPEAVKAAENDAISTSDHVWEVDFIMDMHYGMLWHYGEEILQ